MNEQTNTQLGNDIDPKTGNFTDKNTSTLSSLGLSENYNESLTKIIYDIDILRQEIATKCSEIVSDLPCVRLDTVQAENNMFWDELDESQRFYYYDDHLKTIRRNYKAVSIQIDNLRKNETLFRESYSVEEMYVKCWNFWAELNTIVKLHIYDIITPQIPERQTVRHKVWHSIDYIVKNFDLSWQSRLKYLGNHP